MLDLLTRFWRLITNVLWPLRVKTDIAPGVRWTLHVLLVIVILLFLEYLNYQKSTQDAINKLAFGLPFLQAHLLPLLFIIIYAIVVLVCLIGMLMAAEQIETVYEDIDAAWQAGMTALAQAGCRLTELPVFLILGKPESSEHNLFEAARLDLKVKLTPEDAKAPLHVCADRDAVYVTCAGASVLGRLAGILALQEMPESSGAGPMDPVVDLGSTMIPGSNRETSEVLFDLEDSPDGGMPTTLVRRRIRRRQNMPIGPDFLGNPQAVRQTSDRLTHLCRLIARDRQPWCPINGILVLLPLASADTQRDAQQTEEACRLDLEVIQATLQMECPLFVLVCDMEVMPGFREYISRHAAREILRRVGQRFGLAPGPNSNELQEEGRKLVASLCNSYLRRSVYEHFKIEKPDTEFDAVLASNGFLFLFLDEMRERAVHLASIVSKLMARDDHGGWLFGGCYVAATGGKDQQAFVHAVFKRLLEKENCVSWTPDALAGDAKWNAEASVGYAVLSVACLVMLAFWYFVVC